MERRNTLLLTVIAIATLLVAVVGATFAYFASGSINTTNNTTVSATTGATLNTTFTTVGSTINLTVAEEDMLPSAKDDSNAKATETGTITVEFTGGTTEVPMQCKYDLYYSWVNVAADPTDESVKPTTPYTRSDANKNEFTYAITKQVGSTGTPATFVNATNFVANDNVTTPTPVKIGAEQTIQSNGTATTHIYNIETKFFNIDADQTLNANANWKIKFYVVTDNSRCTAVE